MFDLSSLYVPLTASPLTRAQYEERLPSAALRPFVRCFWHSSPGDARSALVVPDTCVDLLFHTEGPPVFCALDDRAYHSQNCGRIDFAVRFFPWSASLFARESLAGSLNQSFDAQQHFPGLAQAMARMVRQTEGFAERCRLAEGIVYAHMRQSGVSADFLNVMYAMLHAEGRPRAAELARDIHLSPRQLERLFAAHTGASPKKLCGLVRYQCLWRAALSPRFDVQDAVLRFGYTDQSHLLRHFKACHSLTLTQALALALARQDTAFSRTNRNRHESVVFLQSKSDDH